MRADDEAGDDVAQHHGLLEAVKENGDHASDQHDDCQVLDEADGMHGVILLSRPLLDARADRSSAKATLSEQQVHTVLNAGKAHVAWV
ncbi:hypothetical protein D9M71_563110 [compost metagenome]